MDSSIINPFDFLGLDINSSLNDLRKSYYKLSLLCHPDKGGDPKDMDTLHKCYLYVKEQLENINTSKKFEDFENEFKVFLKEQEAIKPPTFYEIFTDNPLNDEFNKKFEETRAQIMEINILNEEEEEYFINKNYVYLENSLLQDGYGDLMEKGDSEDEGGDEGVGKEGDEGVGKEGDEGVGKEGDEGVDKEGEAKQPKEPKLKKINYNPKVNKKPLKNIFNTEIIQYKDPIGINGDGNFMRLDMKKMNDFSINEASDYMRAFSSNPLIEEDSSKILDNRPKTLEELIALRENLFN